MNKTLKYIDQLLPYDRANTSLFLDEIIGDMPDKEELKETLLNEFELSVFKGMQIGDFLDALTLVAIQNIQIDTLYDKISVKLLLAKLYYKMFKGKLNDDFDTVYRYGFVDYINRYTKDNILDERMAEQFNLFELALCLKPALDEDFNYIGMTTLQNRYNIKSAEGVVVEAPQYLWMRVAMGMSLKEKNPTEAAKGFYERLSKKKYSPGGSTLIGAGTTVHSMSNCFLLDTQDDMEDILDNVKKVGWISKVTGGIGIAITKLRAEGAMIKSNNTFSTGPIPFAKMFDVTIRAISRGGKKLGAMAIYMENWHYDFDAFLDLKQNAGDEHRRMRTANTAAYISDEFMKRVMNDDDWYMFDPSETPDLTELYGSEFSKRYNYYVNKAEKGEMMMHKKVRAKEQFYAIMTQLQSTSHPWMTWKDTINLRALNNNTGTIHCSNLCTEICLPQDKDNVAVCNLLYVNIVRHLDRDKISYGGDFEKNLEEAFNWEDYAKSVRTGMRHLDNLVDLNEHVVEQAERSDKMNRAVGLGILGLAEFLELLGYSYDSEEAYQIIDRITEFTSYTSIEESCNMADERGAYPNFEGSMWSQGLIPFDTVQRLEDDRGVELKQNRDVRLEWDKLRARVKKGVRNATTMTIAPNASTGLVAGTSPGIDPRFALVFSRTTLWGKFIDVNENLVIKLKELGIWRDVREELISNQGDISGIKAIPDEVKKVYKTCFQIDPLAFVEVASRAQKWIDQSISRNMYLQSRDVEENCKVYIEAWRRGLKTTYYLHMKPRHTAEQSSVKVNKAAAIGKSGFGAVAANAGAAVAQKAPVEQEEPKKEVVEQTDTAVEEKVADKVEETNSEMDQVNESSEVQGSLKGFGNVSLAATMTTTQVNTVSEVSAPAIGKGFAQVLDSAAPAKEEAKSESKSEPKPEVKTDDSAKNGANSAKTVPEVSELPKAKTQQKIIKACPIDPAEREACESCQ